LLAASAAAAAIPAPPDRWVTDEVGLLSPGARSALDQRLEAYERATGRQVIVWIGATIGNEALEPWAAKTFQAWGIGRRGKDDGVALFLLTQDRRVRIEVGYGLEGQLTDLQTARIIREGVTPALQRGDGDAAVTAAVDGILGTLGGEAPGQGSGQPTSSPISKAQLIAMAVFGGLFLLFLITHPRLAVSLLFTMAASGRRGGGFGGGGFSGGGGGFSGGGGRSGGGGASGSW
jgi:uncharacterized protein